MAGSTFDTRLPPNRLSAAILRWNAFSLSRQAAGQTSHALSLFMFYSREQRNLPVFSRALTVPQPSPPHLSHCTFLTDSRLVAAARLTTLLQAGYDISETVPPSNTAIEMS